MQFTTGNRSAASWTHRLLAGVAGWALLCGAAAAQGADAKTDGAASSVSEVVVTGTHIKGAPPVGSPLIEVGRQDIELTGATTTMEVLQLQPQIFNLGITDTQRNGAGGAANITYGSSINLRGLSPFATLTLVDGHRAVAGGTVGAAVDPNSIPTVMLERVDIVADGASATYGSDAIAGVVNLVLRRNFEGVEASARAGFGDHYDEHQFDVLLGHHWSSGQFTIGFEEAYHSALSGVDRDFYGSDLRSRGGADFRTTSCSPGTISLNGVSYAIPAGGVTPASAASLTPNTHNSCDPLKSEDLLPEQQRYSTAATFNQSITSWLSVFGDATFSYRRYHRQVPLASGPLTVTSANPYFVAPQGTGATSETVDYWFGNQGLGDTWTDHGYSRTYQVTLGADVDLPHDWRWETTGQFGRDDDRDTEISISASSAQVGAALASTNPATALNLFGPNSLSLLQSLENNVFIAPGTTKQYIVESTANGPLFSLPGGEVRAAVGFQWEKHTLVDGLIAGTTQSFGPAFGGLQHLGRTDHAFYGELLVPIIGPDNAIPGLVQSLQVDGGLRYTDYDVVGSTTNPKVGVNWTVNNQLKLHGSWGTSFRAPELSELVGPLTAVFFQQYATPGGPVFGYTLAGGNLGLKPETATTWSLGGDWTPAFAPGFKATLNYFNIKYDNQISSYLSNLNILENPSTYGALITNCPSAACSALINKYVLGTGPGAAPEPVFGPIITNPAVFVDGRNLNLATTNTDGFDLQLDYRFTTASAGTFDLGLSGTYFLSFKESLVTGAPALEEVNHIDFPLRFKLRGQVLWSNGPFTAAVFVNYANGYLNDLATPAQQVDSYTTVDLHLQYALDRLGLPLARGVQVGVDVTNLFDAKPPFVDIIPNGNGGGGFDPAVANPIGRIVAFTVKKRF